MTLGLRALPVLAERLLRSVVAPPPLVAEALVVHDLAARMLQLLAARYSGLGVDREALLFGAATYHVGKALHTEELDSAGIRHRSDGRSLLMAKGVAPDWARFAAEHGAAEASASADVELLMVAAAIALFRQRRDRMLEQRLAGVIAARQGLGLWEVLECLEQIFEELELVVPRFRSWAERFS